MRLIARRVARAALTLMGVLSLTFVLVRVAGDPVDLLLPIQATDAEADEMRKALGLDQPLLIQYFTFLSHAVRGDFGNSLRGHTSATGLVLERFPATVELAVISFGLGILLAFVGGVSMQLISSRRLKSAILWLAFVRQSIPVFLFGLVTILVFSVVLGWLPSSGRGDAKSFVLPAMTLATYEFVLYLRLFNVAFAEEAGADYVRTAYAKGQSRSGVVLRQMLPNALLPLITVAGLNFGVLLGGTVVTETVFAWPGVGRLIVQSVSERDYPVVQAAFVLVAVVFIVINLVVDLLYVALDPRIKSGAS